MYLVQLRIKSPQGDAIIFTQHVDAFDFYNDGMNIYFQGRHDWLWRRNVAMFKTANVFSIQEDNDASPNLVGDISRA